jgi:hypothetical protein
MYNGSECSVQTPLSDIYSTNHGTHMMDQAYAVNSRIGSSRHWLHVGLWSEFPPANWSSHDKASSCENSKALFTVASGTDIYAGLSCANQSRQYTKCKLMQIWLIAYVLHSRDKTCFAKAFGSMTANPVDGSCLHQHQKSLRTDERCRHVTVAHKVLFTLFTELATLINIWCEVN